MNKELTAMIFDIQSYPFMMAQAAEPMCSLSVVRCSADGVPIRRAGSRKNPMFADRTRKWDQGCKACIDACPHGSITFDADGRPSVNWVICNECETIECVNSCAAGSLKQCVRILTVDDLMKILKRDFSNWGAEGGVTFSGGEPSAAA